MHGPMRCSPSCSTPVPPPSSPSAISPAAVHASTLDDAVTALAGAALDTPVVAYCSVGYRSAGLADGLGQRGYTRVYNLEGSLFQWANEGRPLVDADGPVNVVHPYGEPWSDLLDEARRGPDPAVPPR